VPVSSMTGFARTEGEQGDCTWACEIKSVNAKGLDVRFRLPSGFESLEQPLRDLIGKRFQRGSLSVNLAVTRRQSRERFRVNHDLLDQIVAVLPEIQSRLPGAVPPTADGLLAIRGVVESVEVEPPEAERVALETALVAGTVACLESVGRMRAEEGQRLTAVLGDHLGRIAELCAQAETLAATQPESLRRRLMDQLAEIVGAVPALSPDRLAQEVALLVAKADVREELDRLASHREAAARLLNEGGAVGRKFDFLCQEFIREVNTLCSKSADVDLTRRGLDLKAVVEQLREQVQNIE
jgi:uncharacterized protein (TIGR00255 family)